MLSYSNSHLAAVGTVAVANLSLWLSEGDALLAVSIGRRNSLLPAWELVCAVYICIVFQLLCLEPWWCLMHV